MRKLSRWLSPNVSESIYFENFSTKGLPRDCSFFDHSASFSVNNSSPVRYTFPSRMRASFVTSCFVGDYRENVNVDWCHNARPAGTWIGNKSLPTRNSSDQSHIRHITSRNERLSGRGGDTLCRASARNKVSFGVQNTRNIASLFVSSLPSPKRQSFLRRIEASLTQNCATLYFFSDFQLLSRKLLFNFWQWSLKVSKKGGRVHCRFIFLY